MRRLCVGAVFGMAGLSIVGWCAPAVAQQLRNEQIEIAYVEPTNPDLQKIYVALKARRVLEALRAFLAPLKLSQKILIKVDQCDKQIQLYRPGQPVVICYEYITRLQELASKIPLNSTAPRGLSREDAVIGAFVQAVLQQTSSAVFDVLGTPIWGREQDAADKLAAFLMLQFGPTISRKLMNGAIYFFESSDRTWTGADFSDVHGTESQRFYNYVCIAYGADPHVFGDLFGGDARRGFGDSDYMLPPSRAASCPKEYADTKWAFDSLILPHVDRDLLAKVLARDWLRPFEE